MDIDAIIGELYRKVRELEAVNSTLIGVVRAIKDGTLPLDRIEADSNSISVRPGSEPE